MAARRATIAGTAAGVAAFAAYLPGAGRTLSYDSAATVGYFVDTPGWLDAFRRQVDLNNHPLFSFLTHVVTRVTGSRDEVVLRMLPMLAAALAVGLLVWAAARRFGVVPALAGGALLATNATWVTQAREVRGYSLAALCAVVSTLLAGRLLDPSRPPSPRAEAAYVLTIAVGLGCHLYFALLLLAHGVAVLNARERLRNVVRWVSRWAVALALGLLPYIGIVGAMLDSPGRGRGFVPGLPGELLAAAGGAYDTLDVPVWTAAVVVAVAALGAYLVAPEGYVVPVLVSQVSAFLLVWLVARQADTYPRFWTWALPGVAWLVAAGVSVLRALAVPVTAVAGVVVAALAPHYTDDVRGYREAAAYLDAVAARGGRACVVASSGGSNLQPIVGYTRRFVLVRTPEELAGCDVVVHQGGTTGEYGRVLADRKAFPHHLRTRSVIPAVVVSRTPLAPAR